MVRLTDILVQLIGLDCIFVNRRTVDNGAVYSFNQAVRVGLQP
jgi:hypothetical protein